MIEHSIWNPVTCIVFWTAPGSRGKCETMILRSEEGDFSVSGICVAVAFSAPGITFIC